jgi:hypothetical protein
MYSTCRDKCQDETNYLELALPTTHDSQFGIRRSIALQQKIIEIDRHHIFCIAMNPLAPDSSIESNSVDRVK